MKNFMKKSTALAASIIMSSALAVSALSAYAAGGQNNAMDVTPAETASFEITKDIVVFNTDGSDIYEPNVTYEYSVAPCYATDATVTGYIEGSTTDTVTVKVKQGIAGGVTIKGNDSNATAGATATLAFGDDDSAETETNVEGSEVSTSSKTVDRELKVNIDADAIWADGTNAPGIYRYKISDTTTDAVLEAAGILRNDDYVEDLYLDVYTKYNDDKDGLVVYGYVVYRDANGDDEEKKTFDILTDTTLAEKISGYDVESETETTDPDPSSGSTDPVVTIISDQYHTANVTVSKTVAGALADKNHEFPFQVDLANASVTSEAEFYYQQSGDASATSVKLDKTNGTWGITGDTLKLKDGESITITGVPIGVTATTTVKTVETNNTADTYTVSATVNGSAATLSNTTVAPGGTAAYSAAELATDKNTVIAYTNTLEEISPTGLLFTIAPFAALLAVGGLFFGLFRRNKKNDAENII